MDALLLESVIPEIRDELTGRPVTKVRLVGKYGVLLGFGEGRARPDARHDLFLSAHPELSRVGLVETPPAIGEPRNAPDSLSEPLEGARLESVEQEAGGRVVRLRFEHPRGRHRSLVLVGELIPRFANLVLVGNEERILWSRREFTGEGRPRQVASGRKYRAPSGAAGAGGAGPAGPPPEREPRPPRLAGRGGELRLVTGEPAPGWKLLPDAPPNETADRYYRAREEGEAAGRLRAELRRVLVKRRRRAAKALRQIEARLEEAARETAIRHQAELLTAHLHQAKRGMESIRLRDFDGSGVIEIPLDPRLDPKANADALFRKARRLARGRDRIEAQRAIQETEIARADQGVESLEALGAAPDPAALRALVQEFAPSLLRGPGRGRREEAPVGARGAASGVPRSPTLPAGFLPRRYELPGGWEVWVGRSAEQNDELTHRYAAPRDLWFHARGAQGSHTVLRVGSGKGEVPREVIEAAAAIAAHHSKARHSGLVPVAYTEKRYVRKPRGAPPGTASMMREKVLMVEPRLPEGGEGMSPRERESG